MLINGRVYAVVFSRREFFLHPARIRIDVINVCCSLNSLIIVIRATRNAIIIKKMYIKREFITHNDSAEESCTYEPYNRIEIMYAPSLIACRKRIDYVVFARRLLNPPARTTRSSRSLRSNGKCPCLCVCVCIGNGEYV